ncbi:MAG: AmmeMemoRadiSam system protein B [Thermodesulfobacteriota bacterium]
MGKRERNLPRGWYPVDRKTCQKEIESFLEGWSPSGLPSGKRLGGIVPHAGWYFSGRLAARVFQYLKLHSYPQLIVLFGGHLGGEEPPRIVTEDTWETPFGEMEIHTDMVKELMKRIEMKVEPPTSGDNTMEIQLPMIKYFFPDAKLLAVRSPSSLRAKRLGEEVAKISKEEGLSLLAIGSTDLTHYGPNYGFITKGVGKGAVEWVRKENDKGFIEAALDMDVERLLKHAEKNESACSAGAAVAAIATSKALGANEGVLLDYYTSYDIMPDESFVGYAGIVY